MSTLEDVTRAGDDLARANLAHREAVVRRDETIREALAAGESVRDVAEAAQLTVYRVYQIRDRRR